MIGGLELDGQDIETWINNDLLLKQQQTENRRTRKRRFEVTTPVSNTEGRILRPRIDNTLIESQNLNVASDINELTASRTRPIHSNRLTASRRSTNNSNNNHILRNANVNLTQNSSQANSALPAQILPIPSSSASSSSSTSQGATGASASRNEHQNSSTTTISHSHNNLSFPHNSIDPIYTSQSSNWLNHFLLANQTQNLHDSSNQQQQANYSVFHQLQHAVALATTAAAAASSFPSLLSNSTRSNTSTTNSNNNTTPSASELDPWILYNYLLTVGSSNYYQSSSSSDNHHNHQHHHHNSNAQNNADLLQIPNQNDILHLNQDGVDLTNSYWPNPFNPNIRASVPGNPISSELLNQNQNNNNNQNSLLQHDRSAATGTDFSNNHYFPVHLTQEVQSSVNHRDSGSSNHTRNNANSIRSNVFTNRFNYNSMCPYHPMNTGSNNLIYQNTTSVGPGLNGTNPTTTSNQSETTNNNRTTTNNTSNAPTGALSNYFYPTTEFYYPFWHITPSFQPIYSINSPNIDTLFHLAAHFEQRKRGISRDELDKMPTYRFKANKNSEDVPKCIVCLDDFEPKQNIRTLCCKHEFHAKCIDKWLKINRTCPSCRADAFDGSAQKDGA